MLKNFAAIRSSLDRLNRVRLSRYERNELLQNIRAYVQAAWRTDEIRRSPPSPIVRALSNSYSSLDASLNARGRQSCRAVNRLCVPSCISVTALKAERDHKSRRCS